MQLSPEDEQFRDRLRRWLEDSLTGRFAALRGAGGPGREHQAHAERMEWERHLAATAGPVSAGRPSTAGAGLPLTQEVIFHEEYARAGGPARSATWSARDCSARRSSTSAAPTSSGDSCPGSAGTELLVPGLQRAQRRQRPRERATTGPLEDDEWVLNGQKVWTSLAQWSDWCFVVCRTEAGSERAQGPVLPAGPHGRAGHRGPRRSPRSPAPPSSTRCSSTTPAPRATTSSARPATGWKVAMGTLVLRTRRTHPRPADRASSASSTGSSTSPEERGGRRPADPPGGPPTWPSGTRFTAASALRNRSVDDNVELRCRAAAHPRHHAWSKLLWANLAPGPGELAMDVPRAARWSPDGDAATARRLPPAVPLQPGRHDLRWLQPDPAQHHRRASPGPAPPGRPRRGPDPPTSRIRPAVTRPPTGCSAGKTVLVTAAAGTGIGFARAKRCAEEGARVVISDKHERRLAEAARPSCAAARRPVVVTLRRDRRGAGAGAVRRRGRASWARSTCSSTTPGSAAPPTLDEMTDEQWSRRARRHAERHVPLHAGRAEPHVRARRGGVIVNNASVHRLARAGGPGALRRGQGRRDGAHPVRGDRGGAARRAGQRGVAEPGHAPVPGQGDHRRAARRARGPRGVRPRRASRGRSPT